MTPRVELLLAFVGAAIVAVTSFPVVALPLAKFARVAFKDAAIGFGPRLFAFRVAGAKLDVNALPITSWVRAVGQNPYQSDEERADDERSMPADRVVWGKASRTRRVLAFVLAPRAAILVVASLGLGPARALRAATTAVPQIFVGAIDPLSTGREILARGADVVVHEGVAMATVVVLAKWVGASVLALPGDLLGALDSGESSASKTIAKLRAVTMLVGLVVVVAWLVASIAWLTSQVSV